MSADLQPADRTTWAAPAAERASSTVAAASRREVEVVWRDVEGLTRSQAGLVAKEVQDAFAMVGVAVRWKQTDGPTAVPRVDLPQIQVVLLAAVPARYGREAVLGAAQPHASAAWVYFSNVCRALGLEPSRRLNWTLLERRDLARAIGRVVAHELTHVLAPTLPHAASGLMAPQLKRAFLCESSLTWDPVSARAVAEGGAPVDETAAAIDLSVAEG
jgi:hypothetical protein